MMQRSRRTAVYAVLTGLLAAGTLTATMSSAHANVAGFCNGSGTAATCTVTEPVTAPASVTVGATATDNGKATLSWTVSCTLSGTTATTSGGATSETPVSDALTLPATAGGQCTVSATVTLPTTQSTSALSVALTYTTAASPSPSPTPTTSPPATGHVVKGYAGKCVDDNRNSSANGAKIVIWTCNNSDKAQLWTYSGGELIHNGKCLNDAAWGGSSTRQILYTCNRALNELWTHLANGEYVLNAKGYKLCLDDSGYSTKNGTQLIVYTCKDSSNQRWAQP
ncbi:MAG: ricin-type beta-trefoil lectin domain protein [Actinomycetota bacterium]|nr:ricin-type beta-trefoil lectin domain protein [Actinomycetota bacterium]